MSKVDFLPDHQLYGGQQRARFTRPIYPVGEALAERFAGLVQCFDGDDYGAVGLDERLPEYYRDAPRALERFALMQASGYSRRPIAAYLLSVQTGLTTAEVQDLVGMASYLATKPDGFFARVGSRVRDDRVRQFVGWYDAESLPGGLAPQEFTTQTILTGIDLALSSEIGRLEIQRYEEPNAVDPSLVVIEHEIDPKRYGFDYVGPAERSYEGRSCEGEVWALDL